MFFLLRTPLTVISADDLHARIDRCRAEGRTACPGVSHSWWLYIHLGRCQRSTAMQQCCQFVDCCCSSVKASCSENTRAVWSSPAVTNHSLQQHKQQHLLILLLLVTVTTTPTATTTTTDTCITTTTSHLDNNYTRHRASTSTCWHFAFSTVVMATKPVHWLQIRATVHN